MVARPQCTLLAWESAFDICMECVREILLFGDTLTVLSGRRVEPVIIDFSGSSNVWGVTRLIRMGPC